MALGQSNSYGSVYAAVLWPLDRLTARKRTSVHAMLCSMQTRESVLMQLRGAYRFDAVLPGCGHSTVHFKCLKFAPIFTSSSTGTHLYGEQHVERLGTAVGGDPKGRGVAQFTH